MSKRFKVIKGSEFGHCCIEATIVDTSTPKIKADGGIAKTFRNGKYYPAYEIVCECPTVKIAAAIAKTLNKHHSEKLYD